MSGLKRRRYKTSRGWRPQRGRRWASVELPHQATERRHRPSGPESPLQPLHAAPQHGLAAVHDRPVERGLDLARGRAAQENVVGLHTIASLASSNSVGRHACNFLPLQAERYVVHDFNTDRA